MQTSLSFDVLDTQCKRILEALKRGERLTQLDILNRFGAMQAGTRIFELRQKGHPIQTRMVKTSTGKRVAEYSLVRRNERGV